MTNCDDLTTVVLNFGHGQKGYRTLRRRTLRRSFTKRGGRYGGATSSPESSCLHYYGRYGVDTVESLSYKGVSVSVTVHEANLKSIQSLKVRINKITENW